MNSLTHLPPALSALTRLRKLNLKVCMCVCEGGEGGVFQLVSASFPLLLAAPAGTTCPGYAVGSPCTACRLHAFHVVHNTDAVTCFCFTYNNHTRPLTPKSMPIYMQRIYTICPYTILRNCNRAPPSRILKNIMPCGKKIHLGAVEFFLRLFYFILLMFIVLGVYYLFLVTSEGNNRY